MYIVQNLFVGERKELEKLRNKLINEMNGKSGKLRFTDISERTLPHFYIVESCEVIKPEKWMKLLTGLMVRFYWSAKDVDNKVFLCTECEESQNLLQCFRIEIEHTDGTIVSENEINEISSEEQLLSSISFYLGKQFNSISELINYSDETVKSIKVWKFKTCDLFGNVLSQGNESNLMYKYYNTDSFIKWLNFKLRNDGIYEVNEKNVFPYLVDLEHQFHSFRHMNCCFILPPYSTRSGNFEVYKYQFKTINGKETICF